MMRGGGDGGASSAYELLAPTEDLRRFPTSTVPEVIVAPMHPPPLRTGLSAAPAPRPSTGGTENGGSTLVRVVPVDLDNPNAGAADLSVAPLRLGPFNGGTGIPIGPPPRTPTPRARPVE